MKRLFALIVLLGFVGVLAGCDNSSSSSGGGSTNPPAVTPPSTNK